MKRDRSMYEFTDKLGKHVHTWEPGPYKAEPITCPACLDRLDALHIELCQKYGWSEWPSDIK